MTGDRTDVLAVSAYPPNKGRLSEYGHMLAEGLASKGLRVKVLSDMPPDRAPKAARLEISKAWTPNNPLSFLGALRQITSSRPRVVLMNLTFALFGRGKVTNFFGFLLVFLVTKIEKLFHFKSMVILHNLPEVVDTNIFGLKPSLLNRLGLLLAEKFIVGCDTVVVLLPMYKKMIEARFGKETHYVPHGAWENMGDPRAAGHDRDSILFLGYMSPSKDMNMLARAYATVKQRHPDLKLKLVTSPHPNFPKALDQLKVFDNMDGVEYLGYLSEEELPKVFEECYAVALPYATATGTSGVLHLVSSAGIPAVGTDLPEMRQNVAEGAGLLLVRDAEGMAQALDRLKEDGQFWTEMSEKNMGFSSSRSWSAVSSVFYGLIKCLEVQ
ncbi:MAG: glycosyltransferase [Conexivisphaerales archaeon]|jgi:glycosyltransferase involved in cell wall biosynthesis